MYFYSIREIIEKVTLPWFRPWYLSHMPRMRYLEFSENGSLNNLCTLIDRYCAYKYCRPLWTSIFTGAVWGRRLDSHGLIIWGYLLFALLPLLIRGSGMVPSGWTKTSVFYTSAIFLSILALNWREYFEQTEGTSFDVGQLGTCKKTWIHRLN